MLILIPNLLKRH